MEGLIDLLDRQALETAVREITTWAVGAIPSVLLVLVLTLVALVAFRFMVRRLRGVMSARLGEDAHRVEKERRLDTLVGTVQKAGTVAIWIVAGMLILGHLGVDIGPLLAGAGVVGLALGFGSQSLVQDVISGFFLLLEDQVRVGDVAVIDGTGGLVEDIRLRTIVLRDLSGTVHVFPHGKVGHLANLTKDWSAAVFEIGVAYKEDVDRVSGVMSRVAAELQEDEELGPKILEPMEVLGLERFDDSAVVIKARLKTEPLGQWVVGRAYRRRLKAAFDAEGIEIPFPHVSLYWGEATDAMKVLVDRAAQG